jgi:nickel/cobalt transporter (NicO) family protein
MDGLFWTLFFAAVTIGSLHSLAPDHWMPLGALARARGWSAGRTAKTTLLCGFGHVTISAVLGVLALVIGAGVIEAFGSRLESFAGLFLIAFGVVYAVWGIRRSVGIRVHGHAHSHYDHIHEGMGTTEWSLLAFYSVDPCVALIPILIAAAPLGWPSILAIIVAYEVACLGTMVALVLPARAGVKLVNMKWLERWEHAAAGTFIAIVGIVVGILGI